MSTIQTDYAPTCRAAGVLAMLLLALPCLAQDVDFFPIQVGDRWVYRREVFDGNFVGDHQIDTCTVAATEETFAAHHGYLYFTSGILLGGGPCWEGASANLRKDDQGNIVIRPTEPFAPPDTTDFLKLHPDLAAPLRKRLERLPGDGELLLFDFELDGRTRDPFVVAFIEWYHLPIGDRILGQVPLRFDVAEFRGLPPPFVSDAPRVAFGFGGYAELSRRAVFEAGIGLTYEEMEGVISPWSTETTLLWARVGGVEFGRHPTAVAAGAWANLKRLHRPPLR